MRVESRVAAERIALAELESKRFVTITAPVDREWTLRGRVWLLRVRGFVAMQGPRRMVSEDECLIYARFEPPPIGMAKTIAAEGLIGRTAHGAVTLTLKSPRLMRYEEQASWWAPATWNRALAHRLRPHAETHPLEVALVEALVLGRGEHLTEEMRESFKRGGTYHLLVLSGLQIALAAALLAAMLRWLHAPRVSDWSLLAFAVLAPLFIGPTASVSRASIGIGLYAVSRIARRPTSLENLWCVAAMVCLILEPRDLAHPGFQLTFAGAAALLFIGKHFGAAVGAELTIAPLTLFHFHQYALGGSLLTIAMTPLIFAMLVVGAIACAIPAGPLFDGIAALHAICRWMNDAGAFASGWFAAPMLAAMVAGYGAALVAIAFARGKRRAVAIAVALLIPVTSALRRDDPVDAVRLTMLDVGQGDALLLRDRAHAMLVDGGLDPRRLIPQLVDRGVRSLDVVVLTHAHPDHCGALPVLVRDFRVRELWITPRRFRGDCALRLLEERPNIRLLRDGYTRTLGAMRIEVFLPSRTFKRAADNNASAVLRVHAEMRRILLTGDIEADAERELADRDIRADLLKIPHHGSRSSTTAPFLDAVQPEIALVSCGRRNLFGHPHPFVLRALEERRIRAWRTDRAGAIDVDLRDGRIAVRPQIDTSPPTGLE